jgi:Smg protein
MFEILMYLFESYIDAGSYPAPDKLSRKLSAAGFEGEDIDEALTWLSALRLPDNYPDILAHGGMRFFAEREFEFIGAGARQFILFAEEQKMISAIEREIIIDRALALQQKDLELNKLKLIMLIVLWDRHQDLSPLLIEELLVPITSTQLH